MTILALGPLTFGSSPDPVRGSPPSGESASRGRPATLRHRASCLLELPQDRVGRRRDVGLRPEVERESHRLAVALAEKWLDVSLEVEGRGRLVRISGASVVALTSRCESARRAPVGEVGGQRLGDARQGLLHWGERPRDVLGRVLSSDAAEARAQLVRR
jgi:hypothetical protein